MKIVSGMIAYIEERDGKFFVELSEAEGGPTIEEKIVENEKEVLQYIEDLPYENVTLAAQMPLLSRFIDSTETVSKETMQQLFAHINNTLEGKHGFCLFVYNHDKTNGHYISNSQREDVVEVMQEFIEKEKGPFGLQTESGEYFFSCEQDSFGKIITYDTREEAEAALAKMETILPAGLFEIVSYKTGNEQKNG